MHETDRIILDGAPDAIAAAIAVGTVRLLAVVSDAGVRLALANGLSAEGLTAEVDEEALGESGLERLRTAQYDCVLIDCDLSDVAGPTLIERIRGSGNTVPIIALIAPGEHDAMKRAGASACVSKDKLSPSRLAQRVHTAVVVGRAKAVALAALRRAEEQSQLLTAVVEQIPVGVVVVLPDGRVLSANRAAERTGLDYFEPNGPLQKVLAEGGTSEQEMDVVDEDSSKCLLRVTARAISGSHGGNVAAVLVLHDLTAERRALAQAQSAVRARENVLAVVSHDLRSPLNAISIAAAELAEGELDDDERTHYAAAIVRGLERCSRLIDDLLDASTMQGGRMNVTPQPTDAYELLMRSAADHTASAEAIGVTLMVEASTDLGTALIDPGRMHQALGNLIGNALQHTPRNGRVVLGGLATTDGITFTVTDTGPGITAEDLPRVFELYWQSRRTRRGSTGLGLAIVRGIVEAHGGYVTVASPPGEGATFSIVLPVCAP